MVLKNVFLAVICAALAVSSGPSAADEYRPDQFLGLDLSRAMLSPKPLGPAAEFAPVPPDARADRGDEGARAQMQRNAEPQVGTQVEPQVEAQVETQVETQAKTRLAVHKVRVPHIRNIRQVRVAHARKDHVAHVRAAKPRGSPTRLARRHGNPLEAQASVTRVQVWPCRSGGICNWKR